MLEADVVIGQRVMLKTGSPVCLIVDIDTTDKGYVQVAWRNQDGSLTEDWFHVISMDKVTLP